MGIFSPSPTNIAVAAGLFIVYVACLYIYRAFFDQLSHIPGPKLAAATLWYEFYYDVVKKGRYTWEIWRMHEKYGKQRRLFFNSTNPPFTQRNLADRDEKSTDQQQDRSSESVPTKSTSTTPNSSIKSTPARPSEPRSIPGPKRCLASSMVSSSPSITTSTASVAALSLTTCPWLPYESSSRESNRWWIRWSDGCTRSRGLARLSTVWICSGV